ncbi:hypothetical protein FGO68_gene9736 [Halteria grandinella]|uniref:Uncharacterized protein n=1 Tax=Halteria grandinella TaxID=5974 RepID=A0A8J8P933_HALGN|nr:hypothetical protein FGO68_gene9736 [Halteria grandinella]
MIISSWRLSLFTSPTAISALLTEPLPNSSQASVHSPSLATGSYHIQLHSIHTLCYPLTQAHVCHFLLAFEAIFERIGTIGLNLAAVLVLILFLFCHLP